MGFDQTTRGFEDRKKEAQVVHLAVKAQLLQGDAVNALRAAKEDGVPKATTFSIF